jgi:uncharacterized protein YndB with AHSA1/START domain
MTITHTVEIARSPEDVFAYLDDVARHPEWQDGLVSTRVVTEGPLRVGSKIAEVRKLGGREQAVSYEITEREPPRIFAFRGFDGPIRPSGRGTIEPVGDGSSSRLTLSLDLTAHGLMGKALLSLARSQAAKQLPRDQERLKQRLESAAAEKSDEKSH